MRDPRTIGAILLAILSVAWPYIVQAVPAIAPEPPPIAGEGFKVLVVYEDSQKLPTAQRVALYSQKAIDYVQSKNGTWRKWDQNVQHVGGPQEFIDAMQQPRDSLPWVYVSNGKTGTSVKLPETEEAFLNLLKQYGG
jgi:hypothetical protein